MVPCDFYDMMMMGTIVVSIISQNWALAVMVDPPIPGSQKRGVEDLEVCHVEVEVSPRNSRGSRKRGL